MTSVLDSDRVRSTLAELRAVGEREDVLYRERIHDHEDQVGAPVYGVERAMLGAAAPLAVSPEVGQVLHALVLARRPSLIVEFGSSLGVSTIYLASGLADLGAGSLISTELIAEKAARARSALTAAGVAGLVEIRVGDALRTLTEIDGEIDMAFLDGSNDLYLPVLELLGPRLSGTAVIAADMSSGDPHHDHYRAYVNDPDNGFLSTELTLDAGLTISTRHPG